MLQGDQRIFELSNCASSVVGWDIPDLHRFRGLVLGEDKYWASVALSQTIKKVDVLELGFDLNSALVILLEFLREADIDNSWLNLLLIENPGLLHPLFSVLVILAKDDEEAMVHVRRMYRASTRPDAIKGFEYAAILWRRVFANISGQDIPTNPLN